MNINTNSRKDAFKNRVLMRSPRMAKQVQPLNVTPPKQGVPTMQEQENQFAMYREMLQAEVNKVHEYPEGKFKGRGIVMCAGGQRYFTCAYVAINMLRKLGCKLPIEVWYLGAYEMNKDMEALLAPLDVTFVNAYEVRKVHPVRTLNGWELNPYSMIHSRFEEVLFLDADNVPVKDPTYLFNTKEYKENGSIFWPDYTRLSEGRTIWRITGVPYRDEAEFESGQVVVNKRKCWHELQVTMHMNEHSDFYNRHIHGDKETYHMAWRATGKPYAMVPTPIYKLPVVGPSRVMCQHDFKGERLFQHRNMDKWKLSCDNMAIQDFTFEEQCNKYLAELKLKWNGQVYDGSNDAEQVKAVREEVVKKRLFWYVVNGNARYLELNADMTIGQGKSWREKTWRIEDEGNGVVLTIIGDARTTCKLKQNTKDQWSGYQLDNGLPTILR